MKPVPVRLRKPDYQCMAIAAWIVVYATAHGGNSPTVQEIADHFGIWKSAAQGHLDRLREFKIADRQDGKLVLTGSGFVPPAWYIKSLETDGQ